MVKDNPPARQVAGNQLRITDGDLTEATVDQNNWVALYEEQSTNSLKYFPGFGVENRNMGNAGFADLDLEADGTGALNDGEEINGDLRWVVYNDANQDDPAAIGPKMRSENLRAAVSDNRTEKPFIGMRHIGAPFDGYIVLEFKADSGSDGAVIEADSSAHSGSVVDIGIPYTELRT